MGRFYLKWVFRMGYLKLVIVPSNGIGKCWSYVRLTEKERFLGKIGNFKFFFVGAKFKGIFGLILTCSHK